VLLIHPKFKQDAWKQRGDCRTIGLVKLNASFSILALAAVTAAGAQTTPTKPATSAHHTTTSTALPKNIPPAHGVMHTAYALKYIDTKIGTGEVAAPMKFFTVQYTGWLAADGKKFDSSLDHGQPFSPPFPIGSHRVIVGWDTGLVGMKVGGKRRLFIPYQLAYGEQGHPPVIPAKSNLIFDVELVALSDKPPAPKMPMAPKPGPGAAPAKPIAPGTPPAGTPPSGTPPAGTPPAGTPPAATPPPANVPATPPASTTTTPTPPPATPHS
jgi:peptidylprolyl isomerase